MSRIGTGEQVAHCPLSAQGEADASAVLGSVMKQAAPLAECGAAGRNA